MIYRLRVVLLFLLGMGATPTAFASPTVVTIRDVTVLNPHQGSRLTHRDVVIRGDTIADVRRAQRGPVLPGQVNGRGKYLLPGLWDAHVHLFNLTPAAFPLLVANGITSVRDMGGDPAELTRWRDSIRRGALIGPRVKFCGPMLEEPNGIKTVNHRVVVDADDARATVAELAKQGVDCIKMRSVKDVETYRALMAATREAGLPLVGHAPFALDPKIALPMGQQTFEHAFYPYPLKSLPADERARMLEIMRSHEERVVPTLVAWAPSTWPASRPVQEFRALTPATSPGRFISPSMYGNWKEGMDDYNKNPRGSPDWIKAVRQAAEDAGAMYKAGVPIVAGTDLGAPFVSPSTAIYDELELLVAWVGLTPAQALAAATWEPARLFNMTRQIGSIERGKLADVILLDADPFQRISNIAKVNTVFTQGRRFGPGARQALKATAVRDLRSKWREARRAN